MLLRNDGVLVVALAVAAPPSSGPYFGATTTYPMVSGLTQRGNAFELGDMDADGDLDVIATTTTTKIVWRKNNGNGTFAATATAGAGLITEKIAVGKIDGDTKADVVVSGSMGRFAYLKSTGAGWAAAKVYDLWPGEPTPGMPIALGAVCRGSPTKLSVAAAYFDEVMVVCGNGGDGFDNVVEPHGEVYAMSAVDYHWDPDDNGGHETNYMLDLATWSGRRVRSTHSGRRRGTESTGTTLRCAASRQSAAMSYQQRSGVVWTSTRSQCTKRRKET